MTCGELRGVPPAGAGVGGVVLLSVVLLGVECERVKGVS